MLGTDEIKRGKAERGGPAFKEGIGQGACSSRGLKLKLGSPFTRRNCVLGIPALHIADAPITADFAASAALQLARLAIEREFSKKGAANLQAFGIGHTNRRERAAALTMFPCHALAARLRVEHLGKRFARAWPVFFSDGGHSGARHRWRRGGDGAGDIGCEHRAPGWRGASGEEPAGCHHRKGATGPHPCRTIDYTHPTPIGPKRALCARLPWKS